MKAGLLSAIIIACSISQAPANIIDVTYTGFAWGSKPTCNSSGCNLGTFVSKPYTAEFVFNTDKGILQITGPDSYRLDGGLVSAYIDLGDLGRWSGPFNQYGNSFLTWNDDFSFVSANAGGTYYLLSIPTTENSVNFQFGSCPSAVSGPCGGVNIQSFSMSIVPGPVVGSGIPVLIIFGLASWLLRRFKPVVS